MQFDPLSFEYNETPDIAVADGKVGVLNILVYVVITLACLTYLFTQWSAQEAMPSAETVKTGALP